MSREEVQSSVYILVHIVIEYKIHVFGLPYCVIVVLKIHLTLHYTVFCLLFTGLSIHNPNSNQCVCVCIHSRLTTLTSIGVYSVGRPKSHTQVYATTHSD